MMIVDKFGGTSVGNAPLFGSVAEILIEQQKSTDSAGILVVVSAMSGVTDHQLQKPTWPRRGDSCSRGLRGALRSG